MWSFNPLLLRLLGENSPSLPCSHSFWGSALDLDLPLRVGRLSASVPRPDRTGLKEQLLRGLWLTQAGAEGGVQRRRGEPAASEAGVTLHQPEARSGSPGDVVPGSWDPGSGGLHRLPGGAVWRVTCAHTQASWRRQQQPQGLTPISGVRADRCGSRPSLELV